MITLGVVTDMHFGPSARFEGKLRKLSHLAPELMEKFSTRMRDEVKPDLVVNLGDVVEDESYEDDLVRYRSCVELLASSGAELVHVAGNHDEVHLRPDDLRALWGMSGAGPLYRSFDAEGFHFVVLHTHETKDVDVRIDAAQLQWIECDLGSTTLPVVVLMHHSAADQDLRGNRWFEKAAHICLLNDRSRLRTLFERHDTRLVLNGHLHWNHLDVIGGVPYVTLQSLVENVDDDEPGHPAAAWAVVRLTEQWAHVTVEGREPARYQLGALGPRAI